MNQNDSAQAEANDATESLEILRRLKTEVFDSDNEKLALAMGRPTGEIEGWLSGAEEIDEDAQEKIHGIAQQRLGA